MDRQETTEILHITPQEAEIIILFYFAFQYLDFERS
jgi:hypothetical protein